MLEDPIFHPVHSRKMQANSYKLYPTAPARCCGLPYHKTSTFTLNLFGSIPTFALSTDHFSMANSGDLTMAIRANLLKPEFTC